MTFWSVFTGQQHPMTVNSLDYTLATDPSEHLGVDWVIEYRNDYWTAKAAVFDGYTVKWVKSQANVGDIYKPKIQAPQFWTPNSLWGDEQYIPDWNMVESVKAKQPAEPLTTDEKTDEERKKAIKFFFGDWKRRPY